MKKNRILSFLLAFQMVVFMLSLNIVVSHAEGEAEDKYAGIFNVDENNAYVLLGEDVVENKCEFLDGQKLGIQDNTHPLYNETSSEQGLVGRKFYIANYMTLNVDKNAFAEGEDDFWVFITYYDFGPSRGSFLFEYMDKSGANNSVRVIKPGTVQRFNTECIYIEDVDFSHSFEKSGGNVRIKTNGYNLFKKIEFVSVSRFEREGRSLEEIAGTPVFAKRDTLIEFEILDGKAEKYQNTNLKYNCTYADATELFGKIANGRAVSNPASYKAEDVLTQRDLARMTLDILEIDCGDADPLAYAKEIGLVAGEDFLYAGDVTASRYSLIALVYNAFHFEDSEGNTRMKEMLMGDYWDDEFVKKNRTLIAISHTYPKYLPYQTITENATGQTYYYMNIMDIPTLRTYVTAQGWNSDGTGFICGFDTGELFFYNTETQMLHYIDKCYNLTDRLNAIMGTDDYIYYPKIDDEGYCGIYKVNSKVAPAKPELVGRRKDRYTFVTPHISNDCKYLSVDLEVPGLGTCVSRYSVEEDEWIEYHKEFPYSDSLTHVLINPGYPDLFCFSHELSGVDAYHMLDRMWQVDLSTGEEAENVYRQGAREDGQVMQGASHELWSNNGEYVYYINIEMGRGNNVGLSPSSVRYNKDGTHRQYFFDYTASDHQDKHLFPSGDDRFIVADGNVITLISQETHERFPISMVEWNGQLNHPYHAHPVVARNKYVVNWGAMNNVGMLGIKWFDFTELAKTQAEGGRYEAGENIERISYQGLDSESSEVNYKGRKAIVAEKARSVYLDISDELIDTANGKLKLSFDYYDNGALPIKISYTSGVEEDNDRWRVYDNFKTVKRTNSNKWKTCEILIDSGNFENIGKHFSDIKITGSPANLYISDLSVTVLE